MLIVFKAPAQLDAAHVKNLRPDFDRLAVARDDVVIDLARTEVIDGSGVGAIVFAFKRLAANGRTLQLRNVSGQPLDLLNQSGLLRTLGGERSSSWLSSALSRLRSPARGMDQGSDAVAATTEAVAPERTKGAA